jgi:ketosteroid isomerase-like protein
MNIHDSCATSSVDRSRNNAKLLNELYAAFLSGDVESAVQFLAPDFVIHVPGKGRNRGDYWGAKGLRQFMSNIFGYSGGLFEMSISAFAVSGDDAFTRERIRINRKHDPAREFLLEITNQFKLRGGKLVESWVIPEDQRIYDAYYEYMDPNDASLPERSDAEEARQREEVLDVSTAVSVDNTRLIAEMYDRFWAGDYGAMQSFIADDVVVAITHRSGMSGVYHGWSGYLAFRERLMAMAGTKYKLEVVALAGSEKDVFATERIRMDRRWDPAVGAIEVVMHFVIESGKIARMDDFPVDAYVWEQFYTPPSR